MKKELRIGDIFTVKNTVTEKMIRTFAEISGDKNPLHLNEEYAKKTIFKTRIAHGFLVGSFISSVLGQYLPGNGTIYLSQSLFFKQPVKINDEISTTVEVIDFPKANRVTLKTTCINQENSVVIQGEASVIPPNGIKLIVK